MKIQLNVTIYKCDHCNKRYLVKSACEKHETFCSKNPENVFACAGCIHIKERSEVIDDDSSGWLCSKTIKYFYCEKLNKRLHPLKAVRKGLIEQYPEQFENSKLFPKTCEHHEY
jgi:hypothetical protein